MVRRGCCATMRARAPQRARRPSRPRAAPSSRALASRGDCAAWPSADSSRSLSRGASRARGHRPRPRPTDAAAMRLWPRGRRRWPSLVPTCRAIDCVWRRARCPRRCATSRVRRAAGPRCVRLPSAAASAAARARAQARSGQPTSTTDHTRCWLCVGLEHTGSGARRRRCAVATRSARHGARARYGRRARARAGHGDRRPACVARRRRRGQGSAARRERRAAPGVVQRDGAAVTRTPCHDGRVLFAASHLGVRLLVPRGARLPAPKRPRSASECSRASRRSRARWPAGRGREINCVGSFCASRPALPTFSAGGGQRQEGAAAHAGHRRSRPCRQLCLPSRGSRGAV